MNGSSRGVAPLEFNTPDAPYFAIKIQDRMYDVDINFIESFTVERTIDSFGTFSFTMVNAMDLNLEDKLMALLMADDNTDGNNISFQYGWSKGVKSRWYSGRIKCYTPTFLPDGFMKFEVTGYITKSGEDVIEQVKSYKGSSISAIVKEVCEDMGWLIEEIEPTVPLSEPITKRMTNITAVDFIRKELEPLARNTKNEPFAFYLESYNNQNHAYFVSANKSISKESTQKNFNFFINSGNYGGVLSWSPSYKGDQTIAGAVMQSPIYDVDTNDLVVYGSEAKSAAKGGASLTVYGSTSPDNMGALLANKWFNTNVAAGMNASMEIVGDPTVQPQTLVNVLPMDHNGDLHFSGGTYLVRKVTDTISGDYRTSLEMYLAGIDNGTKTIDLEESVVLKGKA